MSLPGLFVVGTDTGVGKTFVASAIARTWREAGSRVGVLKPVASGAIWIDGRLVFRRCRSLDRSPGRRGSTRPGRAPFVRRADGPARRCSEAGHSLVDRSRGRGRR